MTKLELITNFNELTMAITRNQTTLVDSKLNNAISNNPSGDGLTPKDLPKIKKKSFISTTADELKLVQWPSIGYVLRWSLTIVIFTALFSIVVGFFDHTFSTGVKFADCTSPKGRAQTVETCGSEAWEIITFRR